MNLSKKLYLKILMRSAIAVVTIIPISFLYDFALTDLTEQQVALQEKTVFLLLTTALVIFAILIWKYLLPIRNIIEKLSNYKETQDDEVIKAERRALIFPYFVCVYAALAFFLVSLAVNFNMYFHAGLPKDSLIYLITSAATTATFMGMGSFYLVRAPLKESLLFIIERHPVKETRPPFFFPISLKITIAFSLMVAMTLAFSGMFASVISKKLLEKERWQSQKTQILTVASTFDKTLKNLPADDSGLFVLFDKNLNISGQPKKVPSKNVLKRLVNAGPNTIIIDETTGWSWVSANVTNSKMLIASGKTPVVTADISLEILKYFLVAALVALILGVGTGYLIARDISVTLKNLSENAVKIANGATDIGFVVGNEDETGILARAFNNMSGALLSQLRDELEKSRLMIDSISQAVETLSPMSKKLVEFSSEQSAASAEQASAAQQTAASSQEVATISDQISRTSGDIVQSAETALEVARSGREKIDLTQSSFNDIGDKVIKIIDVVQHLSDHSKTISGIIEIIEEISDQINLLSLNASLEAAGAQEYGQRFGVVAEEVRNLANRTTDSAGKINTIVERMQKLINDTMSQTNEGADAVLTGQDMLEEVSSQFTNILDANMQASEMVKHIDSITLQQASASEQMTKAMTEVKDTARRTFDNAKELEETIKDIDGIISELKSHVDVKPD